MSYGTLPDREAFIAHVEPQLSDGVYPMRIASQREWADVARAINQGIDAHLEAVSCEADHTTGRLVIKGAASLHTLIRRIVEDGESWSDPDASGMGLASAIMSTLGYEWI
jgi:hypothetical protein